VTNASGQVSKSLVANSTTGSYVVTATAAGVATATTFSLTNSATVATRFTVSALATTTAGVALSTTITVLDQFSNKVTGYRGTIHFPKPDPRTGAVVPANYTFTASDAGIHTFTNGVTLVTAGTQTFTATDTANSSVKGTATVTDSPNAVTRFGISSVMVTTAG